MVKEVRGFCALGYKPGDRFTVESFYIRKLRGSPYACTR